MVGEKMSILDVIILIIIVASLLMGYKKGLILTLVSMGSYIVAALVTKSYYLVLSNWIIKRTPIGEVLRKMVYNNLSLESSATVQEGIFSSDSSVKLFKWANEYLAKDYLQEYAVQTIDAIKDDLITKITLLLTNIISIVLLFIIIRSLIILIGYILNNIFELPFLETINRTAGLALGGIRGVLIVVLLLIIMLPSAMAVPEGKFATLINSSILIQLFFNNILVHILNWFL